MKSENLFIKISLLFGIMVLLTGSVSSQEVVIHEQPAVEALMDRFIELNREKEKIKGWRIQILATDDKRKMESEKRNFEYQFPYLSLYWVYETPYYKLRVGVFSEKLEAERQLNKIRKKYPSAYSVRVDDIEPQELLGS